MITSKNIVEESNKEYQWGTPAKQSTAQMNKIDDGGDKTHPVNSGINVNRKQPVQFLSNPD